jgi:AcrR family transcriptional regulator
MGGFVVEGVGERRDARESRRRVLAVARRLFGERGVGAVSMHEVGRAAGVGQGTLYRKFAHKGALCAALLGEEIEAFLREIEERVGDEETPALERLGWLFGRLSGFNEENGALLGGMREAGGGGRRIEMRRNPFYGRMRETVIFLLRRAVERGEAAPGLDPECLVDALLATLEIDLYLYQRHELGMDRERIVRSLHRLLDGLRVLR